MVEFSEDGVEYFIPEESRQVSMWRHVQRWRRDLCRYPGRILTRHGFRKSSTSNPERTKWTKWYGSMAFCCWNGTFSEDFMAAETTGCFAIGQALWKWWTAVPIPEASDKQEEKLSVPILPILPRQVSSSSEEEDWEVNSPDLRAHRRRSPSWTMSPKKALPPREPRRQQPRGPSRNGRALKWWAHFTPGGEDACVSIRGRSRTSRSLTRPEDVVHFVRVMPPPPLVFVLPVPVGFNVLQQKAFNDLSKASDLEDKVNKLDELNSLLQR
eukprot:symbB.v1.2.014484.t1/scaffold1057.1/size140642/4